MQKYRNNTRSVIALDCLTRTVYLKPGEIATLPETRDVRYYSSLRHLVRVKEPKKVSITELTVKVEKAKYKKFKKEDGE